MGLNGQVIMDEFCRIGVIGLNAAHFGSGKKNIIRFFSFKELVDGFLVFQVDLDLFKREILLFRKGL